MMQETVRDVEIEEKVYQTLVDSPDRTWNVATLVKELVCSRAKIERAFIALEVQGRITVEHAIGNSWIPHLKHPDGSNGKRGKGN